MAFKKVFESGPRLIDGDLLNRALGYGIESWASGITAKAAGTVVNSPLLTENISQVDTVVTGGDGVAIPAALPGDYIWIINNSANAIQVFAQGGSTINGTAGATGLSQAGNKVAGYVCAKAGAWFRLLSA